MLSWEWTIERVREDASGDREDGEEDDDELLCVIGGSKESPCLTRLAKISGSSLDEVQHTEENDKEAMKSL